MSNAADINLTQVIRKILDLFPRKSVSGDAEDDFYSAFLSHPANSWIAENPAMNRSIETFFNMLPGFTLQRLIKKNLYLVFCNGHMSCSINAPENTCIIMIFPSLHKTLISADPFEAYAILAHEIGHVLCEHGTRDIHPIEAQFEADAFACSLGFKHELCNLLAREDSEESRIRLDFIATNISSAA